MTFHVQKMVRGVGWDMELRTGPWVPFSEYSGTLQSTGFVPGTVLGAEDKGKQHGGPQMTSGITFEAAHSSSQQGLGKVREKVRLTHSLNRGGELSRKHEGRAFQAEHTNFMAY